MLSLRRSIHQAFTLVELLVILAIILVITGLILPIVNSAKEKGRREACANNLKLIGIAILAYAGDNQNHVPTLDCNRGTPPPGNLGNNGDVMWDGALIQGGYLTTPAKALLCPDDQYNRPPSQIPRSYAISCGANSTVVNGSHYWLEGSRFSCPLINPSAVALVGERPIEGNGVAGYVGYYRCAWGDSKYFVSAHYRITDPSNAATYIQTANYLFFDNHVAWVSNMPATLSASLFPVNPCPGGDCLLPCP